MIQALFQPGRLAQHMGQATQAVVDVAIGSVVGTHQPAGEGGAEHGLQNGARASPDVKHRDDGTGEDPQPLQLAVLELTGFTFHRPASQPTRIDRVKTPESGARLSFFMDTNASHLRIGFALPSAMVARLEGLCSTSPANALTSGRL